MADVEEMRRELNKLRVQRDILVEACEWGLSALISTHPRSHEFALSLESGDFGRRMEQIGSRAFDPDGRVRAALAMQAAIADVKGEGNG